MTRTTLSSSVIPAVFFFSDLRLTPLTISQPFSTEKYSTLIRPTHHVYNIAGFLSACPAYDIRHFVIIYLYLSLGRLGIYSSCRSLDGASDRKDRKMSVRELTLRKWFSKNTLRRAGSARVVGAVFRTIRGPHGGRRG